MLYKIFSKAAKFSRSALQERFGILIWLASGLGGFILLFVGIHRLSESQQGSWFSALPLLLEAGIMLVLFLWELTQLTFQVAGVLLFIHNNKWRTFRCMSVVFLFFSIPLFAILVLIRKFKFSPDNS